MRERLRKWLWDVVGCVGLVGVLYGGWQMIAAKGWAVGLALAVFTPILGYLAFEMVYPMWFGRR